MYGWGGWKPTFHSLCLHAVVHLLAQQNATLHPPNYRGSATPLYKGRMTLSTTLGSNTFKPPEINRLLVSYRLKFDCPSIIFEKRKYSRYILPTRRLRRVGVHVEFTYIPSSAQFVDLQSARAPKLTAGKSACKFQVRYKEVILTKTSNCSISTLVISNFNYRLIT